MIDIARIDWDTRKVLAEGSWSVIYEVGPSIVAKVGAVDPDEAERQRAMADRGLALPVLGYDAALDVPLAVWREVHDVQDGAAALRADATPPNARTMPIAVLLMPRATPLIPDDPPGHTCGIGPAPDLASTQTEEVRAFRDKVRAACLNELGHEWDDLPRNLARYEGKLVALDFGHMIGPWSPSRDEQEKVLTAAWTAKMEQRRARQLDTPQTPSE